ncbi:HIT family protein [Natronococcus roseus]|uniref:HIT family protein n=1 Tax=Natronococcus roseus TaxID=1052014 RepID=UPI00374CB0BA
MANTTECPFCQIVDGDAEATVLLESEDYICFLDKYPVAEGHSLVIPKTHVERFEELDDPHIYEFLERAHEVVSAEYEPDATNIGLNNGVAAGQTIPHLHWHIIPRYTGDMDNPEGGVRGVIPDKQKY